MSSLDDELHIALKIICLLIPPVGLILYFVYDERYPTKSKAAGIWGLTGFVIAVVFRLLAGDELFG